MLDKEEIEMWLLWHAGELVEQRVKLIKLQEAQEHPGMSIDSGYYHRSQENPFPTLEELRQVVVPVATRSFRLICKGYSRCVITQLVFNAHLICILFRFKVNG